MGEKKAIDHARQLIEKYIGKPFFNKLYGHNLRMSSQEMQKGLDFINRHFYIIRDEEGLPKIKWVIDKTQEAIFRYGIKGLVIDPYNELNTERASNISETEYVSKMLSQIKRFAQSNNIHVWFVAHPRILKDYKNQAPTLYDISGSAHFANKTDNAITIHRPFINDGNKVAKKLVLVQVQKV